MGLIGPVSESASFATPAAPGNAATVVLFNSVVAFGAQQMRHVGLDMVELIMLALDQASAASGLKAYGSKKGGAFFQMSFPDQSGTATMPKTYAALAAGSNYQDMFDVSGLDDFKLEYTAGATGPTDVSGWSPIITGYFNSRAVQK